MSKFDLLVVVFRWVKCCWISVGWGRWISGWGCGMGRCWGELGWGRWRRRGLGGGGLYVF